MTALLTPTGSPAERFTSRNPADFPEPSRSQEDWRFTPLPRIREFFEAFEPDAATDADNELPDGAHIETVHPADLAAFGTALTPADRVSALAMAHATRGLHITVDRDAELTAPIRLLRHGVSGKGYTHHVVEIGSNAVATAGHRSPRCRCGSPRTWSSSSATART